MVSGQCWLAVEGVPDAVRVKTGDCFLLPSGRPFRLATDLSLTPIDAMTIFAGRQGGSIYTLNGGGDCFIVGGHFAFTGSHAGILLGVLPPIVHLQKESDKAALRWSLKWMRQELCDPLPGGFLVAQQLAYMMLVQALRLHLAEGLSGDQLHARRSGASLDIAGTRRTCRHVAIDLCHEIQRDGGRAPDGVPDALANAAGRRQADQFPRPHLSHIPVARLRI